MASGVRLNEVLDTQPSLTDQGNSVQKENAGAARVVFEDVSFTYAGSKEPALSHISFTAKPGETSVSLVVPDVVNPLWSI